MSELELTDAIEEVSDAPCSQRYLLLTTSYHPLDEFPEDIMNEMTSLQTATSEFLRQFWSAVNPPPPEQGVLSVATPEQLQERKDKMAGYLIKTEDKIQVIAGKAVQSGSDGSKVQAVRVISAFWLETIGLSEPDPNRLSIKLWSL